MNHEDIVRMAWRCRKDMILAYYEYEDQENSASRAHSYWHRSAAYKEDYHRMRKMVRISRKQVNEINDLCEALNAFY